MLRTNLATRPFYNTRPVRAAFIVAAAVALALILFDVVQLVRLTASQRALGARAAEAEQQAGRLRAEADRTRREIDPTELQAVAVAAREANAIIDRRDFSWTELLGHFEATLPEDVRITAIRPTIEAEGQVSLAVAVEARRAEDLDAFVEAIETGGAFRDALAIQQITDTDGLILATIETRYTPPARVPDAATADPVPTAGAGR